MYNFTKYSDFLEDKTGTYNFKMTKDKNGVKTFYEFDSVDGASKIEGKGSTLTESLDDLINKVLKWEDEQKELKEGNKDNEKLFADFSREELINFILDQTDLVECYEDQINRLEEIIDDKNIQIKQLKDKNKTYKNNKNIDDLFNLFFL